MTAMFKAWDDDEKKWLGDFRIHPQGQVMKVVGVSDGKYEYGTEPFLNVKLVRNTGFKDSDGKDIFEGDILTDKDLGEGVVAWNEIDGGWELDCRTDYSALHNCLPSKILGNIYEKPDMLAKMY